MQEMAQKGRKGVSLPAPKVSGPTGGESPAGGPRKHKYNAKPVDDPEGGQKFPSTQEFKDVTELRRMVRAGEIMSVSRQAMVLLPGGITWAIDALIHHNDGTVEYFESKGKDTPDFVMKEKLFREKYPDVKLTIKRKMAQKTTNRGK